jgi:hypothetical protein
MKISQLVALCALLGILIVSGVSASADEKLNSLQTNLNDTTISGSVNSTITVIQSPPNASRGWWRAFVFLWLGLHVRS